MLRARWFDHRQPRNEATTSEAARPPALDGSVLLLLLLARSGASAETAPGAEPVILLQPPTASPAVRRSLARIRDEISADRFHVILVDSSTAGDPAADIESATRNPEGGTVLVLFGDPEAGQAELCVVRHAARRAAVRRATVVVDDPARMPEALAARALELLRATALELSIETNARRAPQEPPVPRARSRHSPQPHPAGPAGGRHRHRRPGPWSMEQRRGTAARAAPVGRVGLRLSEWAWTRVSVTGLGSRPRVETAYGSAMLSQTVALLECAAIFRRDKRIRPMFSLGAGVLNVADHRNRSGALRRPRAAAMVRGVRRGVGVAFAVGSRAALVTELHALVASPHPVVRFVDTRAATVGYPSVILTLALRVAP